MQDTKVNRVAAWGDFDAEYDVEVGWQLQDDFRGKDLAGTAVPFRVNASYVVTPHPFVWRTPEYLVPIEDLREHNRNCGRRDTIHLR